MSSRWSTPSFRMCCGPSTCTISWKKSAICWSKSRRSKLLCARYGTSLASCAKRRKRPLSPIPCLPPANRFRTAKRKLPNTNAKKAKRSRNARAAVSIWATLTAAVSLLSVPPAIFLALPLVISFRGLALFPCKKFLLRRSNSRAGSVLHCKEVPMPRPVFAYILTVLIAVATVGGLGFVCAAPHKAKTSQHPQGDWRILDPVVYENIAIFPVVSGSSQDTSSFLTLEEGLASGEVIVSEREAAGMVRDRGVVRPPQYDASASVNQLVLINRSKRPLLLLAGELVSGGKQDRIISKDRIVPVGAEPLPLDVFCVEHRRWTGSSSQFTASKTIVHPSVREQAVEQKQDEVWAAIAGGTTASVTVSAEAAAALPAAPRISSDALAQTITVEAPTQSYRKIYEGRRVGGSVDSFVDQVQRRFARATAGLKGEPVVGVIVAYGGDVAWSDIFASGDLFRQYWSKLLRSYAVEALARPTLRETASADYAREFLRRPSGREVQETEAGVYRWREITEGPLALIELDALQPKTMMLHRLLLHRTS